MKHDWIRRLVEAAEDEAAIKDLLQMLRGTTVWPPAFYSIIAWHTGLTHAEIGALDAEVHNEHRRPKTPAGGPGTDSDSVGGSVTNSPSFRGEEK